MTQNSLVLDWMREHGSITSRDAVMELGIQRLAARIHELRASGIDIRGRTESGVNRYGKAVTYSRYWIADDEKKNKKKAILCGIDVPESCEECQMIDSVLDLCHASGERHDDGEIWKLVVDRDGSKHPKCPLIEIEANEGA